jgi:hypothetical protein
LNGDDFIVAIDENEIKEDSMKLVNVAGQSILLAKHAGKFLVFQISVPIWVALLRMEN